MHRPPIPRSFAAAPAAAAAALLLFALCRVQAQAEGISQDRGRELLDVGKGYWFAVGNQFLDSDGNVIQFSGVNWNGFDTVNCVANGLWFYRSVASIVTEMALLDLNVIKLNFATTCLSDNIFPANINYTSNPELQGKSVLGVMDFIIESVGNQGMQVILSNSRLAPAPPPTYKAQDPGIWFNDTLPESLWLTNWQMLAQRYMGNPTVIGVELYNEVHNDPSHPNIVWDGDGVGEPYNWRTAAMRAAEVVHQANPNLLIFVQGLTDNSWEGSNLLGELRYPISLNVAYKLVFAVHDFGPMVKNQTWLAASDFPNNLEGYWDATWGFLFKRAVAPVVITGWGTPLYNTSSTVPLHMKEVKWADTLKQYIRSNQLSWIWYTMGPNSTDKGGILLEDWYTPSGPKMDLLDTITHPRLGPSKGQTLPPTPQHGELTVVTANGTRGMLFNQSIGVFPSNVGPGFKASFRGTVAGKGSLGILFCALALLIAL